MAVNSWRSKKSALIVIDMQNDFCHPDGAMAKSGFDISDVARCVDQQAQLVAAARELDIPVVFVRTEHDEMIDTLVWRTRTQDRAEATDDSLVPCRVGTWGAEFFTKQVSPQPGEIVVTKHKYSAFVNTTLESNVRALGVDMLYLAGIEAEVCVDSTARDALFRDYYVGVVADCCSGYFAERGEASRQTIARAFGLVADSAAVIDNWRHSSG